MQRSQLLMSASLCLAACSSQPKDDAGRLSVNTATGASGSSVEEAIATGDARKVGESSVLDDAITECEALRTERQAVQSAILGSGKIAYSPSKESAFIVAEQSKNPHFGPLMVGNDGNPLAGAGYVGKTRAIAFGSNPVDWTKTGNDPTLGGVATSALKWLVGGKEPTNIALVRFGGKEDGVRIFLTEHFPSTRVVACNDSDAISKCIIGQSLVLIGSDNGDGLGTDEEKSEKVKLALTSAIAEGIPLGYLHTGSWGSGHSAFVGEIIGFSLPYAGNYFSGDSADFANELTMAATWPKALDPDAAICRALAHFKAADYAFDWSKCTDRECSTMTDFQTEFFDGGREVQARISALEKNGQSVFDNASPVLTKLAVLLGDRFRATVKFPIVKTTDTQSFMRALWADLTLASLRDFNPAEDLTNSSFSPVIPDITPTYQVSKSWETRASGFSSSSATYALPGRPFTVTRTDSGTTPVRVFVNMIRWGANHALDGDIYERPMYLWGNGIPIEAGETITLTSAVGGIIFTNFESTTSTETVSLSFNGVGTHPTYTGGDASAFMNALSTSPYGWAELLTPGVEVHSTVALMKSSVNEYNGNAQQLADDTWNYYYKNIYGLAAFTGNDLSHPATVKAFCEAHQWDCENSSIHRLSGLQHFNADQPNCGSLCSGNPIDSDGAFLPFGWGEAHELGHNLQYGELKINDGLSGEVSNNVFSTYVWLKWNQDHQTQLQGRDILQKEAFSLLQNSLAQPKPKDYVTAKLWNESDGSFFWARLVFYWQAVLTSSDVNELGDGGWDLYRLLYLHVRLLSNARSDDSTWQRERSKLGFTTDDYAKRDIKLSANDHYLIAMSFITRRDQRPFFDMWGVTYSDRASAQVESYGFLPAKQRFFVVPCEDAAFTEPLVTAFSVDGSSAWPAVAECK